MPESVHTSPAADSHAPRVRRANVGRAFWTGAAGCTLLAMVGENLRWADPDRRTVALVEILSGEHADWLPFLPLLCLLPFVWARDGWTGNDGGRGSLAGGGRSTRCALVWALSLSVAAVAFGVSRGVESTFTNESGEPFPPAYHDEYSYRLQAETFLAGRTWFPSFEPRPELFDQMHVLNEGRFASRYFPGVGLWLAPFAALGDPWLAQQAAHALCAMLVFWIGRNLRGLSCGLTAGLLFAVSPGLAIFSTLLLSHHPTMLGLLVFLWSFLRLMDRPGVRLAFVAGLGLAFAMLCRPMTAAGVGLPFGLWTAWWLATGRGVSCTNGDVFSVGRRWRIAGALAAPLLAGIVSMLWYSWSITGDALVTPYQLYTDLYTPRHVYGFNNVVRGEQHAGPRVIENYDRWAENLTPSLAARNTWRRVLASLRMTLGILPIAFSLLYLLGGGTMDRKLWLLIGAIASLFTVHVPYWFVGIMEWHYVLESAPLWLLLCGAATSAVLSGRRAGRPAGAVWWCGVLAVAVTVNWTTVPLAASNQGTWLLWRGRLPKAVSEIRFARLRYELVRRQVDALRHGRPAVVLVIADPVDRSLDFVTNLPSRGPQELRVRVPRDETEPAGLADIAELFPDRVPLQLDASGLRVVPLMASNPAVARQNSHE